MMSMNPSKWWAAAKATVASKKKLMDEAAALAGSNLDLRDRLQVQVNVCNTLRENGIHYKQAMNTAANTANQYQHQRDLAVQENKRLELMVANINRQLSHAQERNKRLLKKLNKAQAEAVSVVDEQGQVRTTKAGDIVTGRDVYLLLERVLNLPPHVTSLAFKVDVDNQEFLDLNITMVPQFKPKQEESDDDKSEQSSN